MKQFEAPAITTTAFQVEDIITTSNKPNVDGDGFGPVVKP